MDPAGTGSEKSVAAGIGFDPWDAGLRCLGRTAQASYSPFGVFARQQWRSQPLRSPFSRTRARTCCGAMSGNPGLLSRCGPRGYLAMHHHGVRRPNLAPDCRLGRQAVRRGLRAPGLWPVPASAGYAVSGARVGLLDRGNVRRAPARPRPCVTETAWSWRGCRAQALFALGRQFVKVAFGPTFHRRKGVPGLVDGLLGIAAERIGVGLHVLDVLIGQCLRLL